MSVRWVWLLSLLCPTSLATACIARVQAPHETIGGLTDWRAMSLRAAMLVDLVRESAYASSNCTGLPCATVDLEWRVYDEYIAYIPALASAAAFGADTDEELVRADHECAPTSESARAVVFAAASAQRLGDSDSTLIQFTVSTNPSFAWTRASLTYEADVPLRPVAPAANGKVSVALGPNAALVATRTAADSDANSFFVQADAEPRRLLATGVTLTRDPGQVLRAPLVYLSTNADLPPTLPPPSAPAIARISFEAAASAADLTAVNATAFATAVRDAVQSELLGASSASELTVAVAESARVTADTTGLDLTLQATREALVAGVRETVCPASLFSSILSCDVEFESEPERNGAARRRTSTLVTLRIRIEYAAGTDPQVTPSQLGAAVDGTVANLGGTSASASEVLRTQLTARVVIVAPLADSDSVTSLAQSQDIATAVRTELADAIGTDVGVSITDATLVAPPSSPTPAVPPMPAPPTRRDPAFRETWRFVVFAEIGAMTLLFAYIIYRRCSMDRKERAASVRKHAPQRDAPIAAVSRTARPRRHGIDPMIAMREMRNS